MESIPHHTSPALFPQSTRHTQSPRLVPIIYVLFAVVACSVLVCSASAQTTARSENRSHVRTTIMEVDANGVRRRNSDDESSLIRKIARQPIHWSKGLVGILFPRNGNRLAAETDASHESATARNDGAVAVESKNTSGALRLQGQIMKAELEEEGQERIYTLTLKLEFANAGERPRILLLGTYGEKNEWWVRDVWLSHSLQDALASKPFASRSVGPANSQSLPKWQRLRSKLQASTPPPSLTHIIKPNETYVHYLTTFVVLHDDDEISSTSTVWLQFALDLWPFNLELAGAENAFGDQLNKRWNHIGELWREPILSSPIRFDLSASRIAGVQPTIIGVGDAKDFSYPESPETVRDETPYEARSLAGSIIDPTGGGLTKALVERSSSGWKKRIDATFTDAQGSFSFSRYSGKTHFLKISKPGFNTLLIRIRISGNPNAPLSIKLPPSQ